MSCNQVSVLLIQSLSAPIRRPPNSLFEASIIETRWWSEWTSVFWSIIKENQKEGLHSSPNHPRHGRRRTNVQRINQFILNF
jgi:hypothetical protein